MTLEHSAKWRAWAAGILLALSAFYLWLFMANQTNVDLAAGVFLFGIPGLLLLRGWWKVKRRIRELDYQARAFRKG